MKVLATAVAAALLGLSTVTFAQGSGAVVTTPSTETTVTPGTTVITPSTTTTVISRCDAMTGAEKTRCLRDERASTGSSTAPGVPVTERPGDSGPGATDKTHPGMQPGNAPSPRDVGTSSAGGGK